MNTDQTVSIRRSQNCDTRSADRKVSKEDLLKNSKQHIEDVARALEWMAAKLRAAAARHDYTKIENIEQFHHDFKYTQDGNVADFKQMTWFKDYHLKERHHLNDRCPEDVDMFDVLERIADIVMAGMARTGKVFDDTIKPGILIMAYKNTIEKLKASTRVVEDGAIG